MTSWQAMVQRAKGELIAGVEPTWFGQQQLVESWRRCVPQLGDPSELRGIPTVPESWLDDTSLELLLEPLDALKDSLHDTGAALLLTDARGLVLARWFEDRSAGTHLDSVGSQRAADLSETSVGTTTVSLALRASTSVRVAGSEHFSDFFSHSACVAEPIANPVSAEVLAVIKFRRWKGLEFSASKKEYQFDEVPALTQAGWTQEKYQQEKLADERSFEEQC